MVASRSSAHRNAASVLPDPVGATTSASWPAAIADQAPRCAGVAESNTSPNQVRVAREKPRSASLLVMPAILPTVSDIVCTLGQEQTLGLQ